MDLATPKASKVVGGLGLLVVAALSWVLVIGPETSAVSGARLEVESTRQQNATLVQQLASLEKQRSQVTEARRSARDLAAKFPPTADQPGLFREVTDAAVRAGIGADGVTALAPTPPTIGGDPASSGVTAEAPGGTLARQVVAVSVKGSYDETLRLLQNLEDMPRAYLITTVSLTREGTKDDYTTSISGDMFVMPPVVDPGDAINLSTSTTN